MFDGFPEFCPKWHVTRAYHWICFEIMTFSPNIRLHLSYWYILEVTSDRRLKSQNRSCPHLFYQMSSTLKKMHIYTYIHLVALKSTDNTSMRVVVSRRRHVLHMPIIRAVFEHTQLSTVKAFQQLPTCTTAWELLFLIFWFPINVAALNQKELRKTFTVRTRERITILQ